MLFNRSLAGKFVQFEARDLQVFLFIKLYVEQSLVEEVDLVVRNEDLHWDR